METLRGGLRRTASREEETEAERALCDEGFYMIFGVDMRGL